MLRNYNNKSYQWQVIMNAMHEGLEQNAPTGELARQMKRQLIGRLRLWAGSCATGTTAGVEHTGTIVCPSPHDGHYPERHYALICAGHDCSGR